MTKLIFLGTKGEIEEKTNRHKYNSSLLLIKNKFKLLIDYGLIQKYKLEEIKPNAIIITHAHPDHYIWTKKDNPTNISLYVTKETLNYGKFKPQNYKIIKPKHKLKIGPFSILPYRVMHSIKCPAIGFKICDGKKTLIYNPDLVDIVNKNKILKKIDYYIGDGSSTQANLVRRKENKIFGHTRVTTQIHWCKKLQIKNIIFTHLGRETLKKEKDFKKQHPEIIFAYDGMKIEV